MKSLKYKKSSADFNFGLLQTDTELIVESLSESQTASRLIFPSMKRQYVKCLEMVDWEPSSEYYKEFHPVLAVSPSDFIEAELCCALIGSHPLSELSLHQIVESKDSYWKSRCIMWVEDPTSYHKFIVEISQDSRIAIGKVGISKSIRDAMSWICGTPIRLVNISETSTAINRIHITPILPPSILEEFHHKPGIIQHLVNHKILDNLMSVGNQNRDYEQLLISDGQITTLSIKVMPEDFTNEVVSEGSDGDDRIVSGDRFGDIHSIERDKQECFQNDQSAGEQQQARLAFLTRVLQIEEPVAFDTKREIKHEMKRKAIQYDVHKYDIPIFLTFESPKVHSSLRDDVLNERGKKHPITLWRINDNIVESMQRPDFVVVPAGLMRYLALNCDTDRSLVIHSAFQLEDDILEHRTVKRHSSADTNGKTISFSIYHNLMFFSPF